MRGRASAAALENLLAGSGLDYQTRTRSYVFDCPLCKGSDKLYMYRSDGRFLCVKCAESNKFRGAPEFALAALGLGGLQQLRKLLYGDDQVQATAYLDIRLEDLAEEDDEILLDSEVAAELPDLQWPYHCYPLAHPWAERGKTYLERRGIPLEVAAAYDIRYSTTRQDVAFPAWVGARLAGWQFRITGSDVIEVPRQRNPEIGPTARKVLKTLTDQIPRERCVMFANRLDGVDHAVLCEGPVDALKCHLVKGNIAAMGKGISAGQIELLIKAGIRKLYLALDPDAVEEVERLLTLFPGIPIHEVKIPRGFKDIGEMSMEAAREAVLTAPRARLGQIRVFFKHAELVR